MLPAASAWLARCCERLTGIEQAALYVDDGAPAACWPDPDDAPGTLAELVPAARAARRAVSRPNAKDETGEAAPGERLALPIELGRRRVAVLVVAGEFDASTRTRIAERVGAAGEWLGVLLSANGDSKGGARHALLTKLVTKVLEPERFSEGCLALVSELATALAADRVSLGFLDGTVVRLEAVSHSARFDSRTRLGRSIAAAMEESIDAESVVHWPSETDQAPARAHAALCQSQEMGTAFSVPLTAHGVAVGAITAEYRERYPAGALIASRLEQLATLLGPLIAIRRSEATPPAQRLVRELRESYARWRSADRLRHRMALVLVALVGVTLMAIPGTHRVSAPARLEGLVQRAIVAPIEGYVSESRARAGDMIREGEVLGAIDDTDLRLEQRKWRARAAQLDKEYRAALANRDRSEANILRARLDESRAELDLVDEQLARTQLVAPFDGVVAEGDLSRSLGSPVERGEVLFQVAPLDRYRIVLEIDEREVDEIARGQTGELRLTALPGDALPMIVERVVPVAVSEDGRNFFRVEAGMLVREETLRPGMEGVAKVDVGRRSLLWIYTHTMVDWLRLHLWAWVP